jgi:Phage integrase, N-terminal SAM-like domain
VIPGLVSHLMTHQRVGSKDLQLGPYSGPAGTEGSPGRTRYYRTAAHTAYRPVALGHTPSPCRSCGPLRRRWLLIVKPVSWENYERNIRLHLKPAVGNVKLAKLPPGRIQALYDKKRSTMSPASVKLIHAVLHKALKLAQMWRLVRENVAEATVRPRTRAGEIKPLDTEKTKALLAAVADDRNEALYTLALTTDARTGKLLALRRTDLDADACILRIERTRSAAKNGPRFTTPKGRQGTKRSLDAASAGNPTPPPDRPTRRAPEGGRVVGRQCPDIPNSQGCAYAPFDRYGRPL